MKCPECLGERFNRGRYDYVALIDDRPVLFRNVPAQRCQQCDYLVVSATTLEKMDRIVSNQLAKDVVITNVFDFAQRPDVRVDSTVPFAPAVYKTA